MAYFVFVREINTQRREEEEFENKLSDVDVMWFTCTRDIMTQYTLTVDHQDFISDFG